MLKLTRVKTFNQNIKVKSILLNIQIQMKNIVNNLSHLFRNLLRNLLKKGNLNKINNKCNQNHKLYQLIFQRTNLNHA